jgi:parvulin-like peptidyl-prolyl isomerase
MRKRFFVHFAFLSATLGAAGAIAPCALAQDSTAQDSTSPSVAEAARLARARKKSDKPVTVVTDDTLKPAPNSGAASTQSPLEDSKISTTPIVLTTNDSPTPEADEMRAAAAAESDATLKALKKQLADAEKNLELLQLDLALQQDTYFSNPDYIHDKAGKAKVDAIQATVTANQQIVDELRVKLAALEKSHAATSSAAPTRP